MRVFIAVAIIVTGLAVSDAAGQPADTGEGNGVPPPAPAPPDATEDVLDSVIRFSDAVRDRMPGGLRGQLFDIEAWDSLNILSFIMFVDRDFKLVLSPDAIGECQTVGDLQSLVKSQLMQAA